MVQASVIIAAYNAEAFIADAVRSAAGQTLDEIEIIVVDDCSTDATAAIVAGLAAGDARIRLVRQERNAGPAAARNRAIDVARGRWIAILDADDRYEPPRLERLIGLAEERGADLASDNLWMDPEDQPESGTTMIPRSILSEPRQLELPEFVERNVHDSHHPGCNFGFLKPIFRAAFLADHALRYDESVRFAEDFTFYVACLRRGARWWLTPEPLYHYLIRARSLTQVQTVHDLGRLREQQRQLLIEAQATGDRQLERLVRRHMVVVDRCYYYRWFTDEVKARRPGAALRVLGASRASARLIAAEAIRQAPVIAAKAFGGGYRKD